MSIDPKLKEALWTYEKATSRVRELDGERYSIASHLERSFPPVRVVSRVLERLGRDPNGLQRIAQLIQEAERIVQKTRYRVEDVILQTPSIYNTLPTVTHYQGVLQDKPGYLNLSFTAEVNRELFSVRRNFQELRTRWAEGALGVETRTDGSPVIMIPADRYLVIPSFSLDNKFLGAYPVAPTNLREGVLTAAEVNHALRYSSTGQFVRIP